MPEVIDAHREEVLSDITLDFYEDYDVEFHFDSGREWESETTVEERDDGTTVEKSSVCTIPCPNVSIYDRDDGMHGIVHLKNLPDPIIIAHLRSEDTESPMQFLDAFVASLETSYEGIEEVDDFKAKNDELAEVVREALNSGTPECVTIPMPAP